MLVLGDSLVTLFPLPALVLTPGEQLDFFLPNDRATRLQSGRRRAEPHADGSQLLRYVGGQVAIGLLLVQWESAKIDGNLRASFRTLRVRT